MPSKNPPPKDEKPQKQRFMDAAKEAGVNTDQFERAVKKVAPARKPSRASS